MRRTFGFVLILLLLGFVRELHGQITVGADIRTGAIIPISTNNDSHTEFNSRRLGLFTELRSTLTKQLGARSKVQYAVGYQHQWFEVENKSSGLGGSINESWKVNAGWLTLGATPIIPLCKDDRTRLKFGLELVIPVWAVRTGSITYGNGSEGLLHQGTGKVWQYLRAICSRNSSEDQELLELHGIFWLRSSGWFHEYVQVLKAHAHCAAVSHRCHRKKDRQEKPMINTRTFQKCAVALLFGVFVNVVFIQHCSAQRNISVGPYYGKVVTTYTKEVRGSASTKGLSGYGAQLHYAEPMTEKAEILIGIGYHVQNLEWDITAGSQCCSFTDSMSVRASYFSMILGAKWYLDNAKHFSFFFAAQWDLPITNQANGRMRDYIPLTVDRDTIFNGKLNSYGKFNVIPTIGFDYQRPINSTYQLGIGCYFQYGMTAQWGDHLRTGEGGIRIFLKRNFLSKLP